ncbi:hypothetical protein AB1Y20_020420 [Prymnesium parvum]|uniref:Deacetylase sirtuin-type domain-containing protein n=1 Tax=Prymnesium parvum TaxID=97485 RepID=A0AB34JXB3_PRYPA
MSLVYLRERDAVAVPPPSTSAERHAALENAAEAIIHADGLLFTAGAGMGVDSGLPDFRGTTTGLFAGVTEMTYEQMSDDRHFLEDPLFAWGVNSAQMNMYRKADPHSGYLTLKKWAEQLGKEYFVWTSNIDGQFRKAGFPAERIVTCHGEMEYLQCTDRKCCQAGGENHVWSSANLPSKVEVDATTLRLVDASLLETPAFRCPRCGSVARPNVWFCSDQNYWSHPARHEASSRYRRWLETMHEGNKRLVVIECGAGLAIPAVRCEGEDAVEHAGEGSFLVRVNPSDCRVPAHRGIGLPFAAAHGLCLLDKIVQQHLNQA